MALRRDPTLVRAAAALGINALFWNDTAAAKRVFSYSEKLSRRDIPTQIWAVEDAVARGDVPGALEHYDIALRTSPHAPDLMYPQLTSAISDETVRFHLVRTLAAKPAWWASFVDYVAGHSRDTRAMSDFFTALRRAGVPLPDSADAAVIHGFIMAGDFERAWNFYRGIRKGVDRQTSRDPNFTASLSFPSFFDWMPANDGSIFASIEPGRDGRIFAFAVPAGDAGTLLQQVQLLPPGRYRLKGRSEGLDAPAEVRPFWLLTCRDGRELSRFVLPNSAEKAGTFETEFAVPAECPLQTLSLIARPSDTSSVTGQINQVRIYPVRQADRQ
jgi:hypothetical protein